MAIHGTDVVGAGLRRCIPRAIPKQMHPDFDPGSSLSCLVRCLEEDCREPGFEATDEEAAAVLCMLCCYAANGLLAIGAAGTADAFLAHAWNMLGTIQRERGGHVNRASLADRLARLHIERGNLCVGARWALLAYADAALGAREGGYWDGRKLLLSVLGMGDPAFTLFSELAADHRAQVSQGGGWAGAVGFAEHIVSRFPILHPMHARLYGLPTADPELPLSQPYARALLEPVSALDGLRGRDRVKRSGEVGGALEVLAAYLFQLVPGWVPRRNLLNLMKGYELDLVVRNQATAGSLHSDLLGRHFLVECKNWMEPVGVEQVGFFLHKMRLTHSRFGVILARRGITGARDRSAATDLVRQTFHTDGSVCVVVDGKQLEQIVTGAVTVWGLLLELVEEMRFGRERSVRSEP